MGTSSTGIRNQGQTWGYLLAAASLCVATGILLLSHRTAGASGAASITVTHDAIPTSVTEPGANVVFTTVVTNTGAAGAVTIESFNDDVYGGLAGDSDCQVGTALAPGTSCTYEFTRAVTGAADTAQTDTLTASATDDDTDTISASDDATVAINPPKATERVSVASDETEGAGYSGVGSVSGDGRYVVFVSGAANLVAGDTNGAFDVLVRDRLTGMTERASIASDGTEGNGASGYGAVSADGRYVVFSSDASNLVPDDTNNRQDIFVRDRVGGTTQRVSVAFDGGQADDASLGSSISADGRYVVFTSLASNLVPVDTGYLDIFVHDRVSGTTEKVNVASDGTEADGWSEWDFGVLSDDGRYVAFESPATNLVAGDTNGNRDIFVRDRVSGTTERVNVGSDGTESWGAYSVGGVSADGRYVTFTSYDDGSLIPGEVPDDLNVYVHDRASATTERVSPGTGVQSHRYYTGRAGISADGRHVTFVSEDVSGPNLVGGDVFVRDRVSGTVTQMSVAPGGVQADGPSRWPAVSGDGRYVAFESAATNLVADDTNSQTDVFIRGVDAAADTVSVAFTGGRTYSNSGPLALGDLDVVYNANTTVRTVTGAGTLPGVNGGQASVAFSIRQFFFLPVYLGTIAVNDPGASLNLTTPVLFANITKPPGASATGHHNWADLTRIPWKPYTLTWTITDNT